MSGGFGGAGTGRRLALVGGFAGRFSLACTLTSTLACALCGGLAVPQLELGAQRLAITFAALVGAAVGVLAVALARSLVACAVAALMGNVTVASQGRFHALAAGGALVAPFRRHQTAGAVANQVALAHGEQGFADHRPACGIVVAQQRLVQTATALALGDEDIAPFAAHLV